MSTRTKGMRFLEVIAQIAELREEAAEIEIDYDPQDYQRNRRAELEKEADKLEDELEARVGWKSGD